MTAVDILSFGYALLAFALVVLLAVIFAPAVVDWRWRRGRRGRGGMLR